MILLITVLTFFGILLIGLLSLAIIHLSHISYGIKQAGFQLIPIAKLSDTTLKQINIRTKV